MEKTFEPVVACPQQLPVHRLSRDKQAGVRQTACRCPHTAAHGRIPEEEKTTRIYTYDISLWLEESHQ